MKLGKSSFVLFTLGFLKISSFKYFLEWLKKLTVKITYSDRLTFNVFLYTYNR